MFIYLSPFPPQELSPGTRDFGLVCFHHGFQDLNKYNLPHRKSLHARKYFCKGPELFGWDLSTEHADWFTEDCISTTIYSHNFQNITFIVS